MPIFNSGIAIPILKIGIKNLFCLTNEIRIVKLSVEFLRQFLKLGISVAILGF